MPLAILKYDPNLPLEMIGKLAKALPIIIASALSVQGHKDAALTPNEIEVKVDPHGRLDVNTLPIEITIFANNFPAREKNLDHRTEKIEEEIKNSMILPPHLIGNKKIFIWILLAKGAFKII